MIRLLELRFRVILAARDGRAKSRVKAVMVVRNSHRIGVESADAALWRSYDEKSLRNAVPNDNNRLKSRIWSVFVSK